MEITTRLMERGDAEGLTALLPLCTPTRPPPSPLWWWAHPTIVAVDAQARLVGYASFTISLPPTTALVALEPREIGWGHGMGVHPDWQRRGVGGQLAEARRVVMRDLGLQFFLGHAAPTNAAMIALFTRHGLAPSVTVTAEDGTDVTLYMGAL